MKLIDFCGIFAFAYIIWAFWAMSEDIHQLKSLCAQQHDAIIKQQEVIDAQRRYIKLMNDQFSPVTPPSTIFDPIIFQ